MKKQIIFIVQFLLLAVCLHGEEGMWMANDLPIEIFQEMQNSGLELSQDELYNQNGTGICNAVVSLGGGTGSFVSPEGLIVTNHHVAYGAVQKISSADNNYITEGFLAKSKTDEQPAYGYNAYVLLSVTEVTDPILSKLSDSMSPLERYNTIEQVSKELVKKAEDGKDVECEVKSIFGGQNYYLYTYLKLKDIRIVYVPPRSIGEYGGDIDNFEWPRHTGDFSFLRAYIGPDGKTAEYSKANIPFKPKSYLHIAEKGLQKDDFAFIVGYPGRTQRYLTAYGIKEEQDFRIPYRLGFYSKWVQILDNASKNDPQTEVKVTGTIKGLNNAIKYYQGLLDGFKKFDLLDKKRQIEQKFQAFLNENPEAYEKYHEVLPMISASYTDYNSFRQKSYAFNSLERVRYMNFAFLIYKWSIEKQKAEMDRDPEFMNNRIPDLKYNLEIAQKTLDPKTDKEVMRLVLHMIAKLPADQRITGLDEWIGDKSGQDLDNAISVMLDQFYSQSKLGDADTRLKMFEMKNSQLLKQNDPFINLAKKVYAEKENVKDKDKAFDGALSELMPRWIAALRAWKDGTLYPDANGTMRINSGRVKGYSPRDAVWYLPFTTLTGVIEKNTGKEPFDAPEKLLELAKSKDYGPYYDSALKDVPVDLLTTNDSTGGNSGSPLLNQKGELVGLLFDGNYESMSADYDFNQDYTRSIHVDIRYVLFITDKFSNARNVLEELQIQ